MVSIVALWLPIVLSAVFVFIVSSAIHMAFGYHANDYRKLPDEDATMDALRKLGIPPGQYHAPRAATAKDMKTPEYQEKMKKGPMFVLNIWTDTGMGAALVQWFLYCVIIGVFAAYIAGRALPEGTPYLSVFRFVGATSFMCYAIGGWQESIWFKRPVAVSLKNTFDGLIYAFITAGVFGWLWPR